MQVGYYLVEILKSAICLFISFEKLAQQIDPTAATIIVPCLMSSEYRCNHYSTRYSWQMFNQNWIFKKNFQISDFLEIRPNGADLFHSDGQTDMTKSFFRNFG